MANVSTKFKRRYGKLFPAECSDIFIDMLIAKKWREPEYQGLSRLDPGEHMLRAIRALFTHDEWSVSPWTEEHVHAWCTESALFISGCASSSKSNDIGGLCVLDWITDPTDTVTIMASTSKQALTDRSYESVLRYFKLLKRNPHFSVPGKEAKTVMAIINDSDDEYGEVSTSKAAVRAVAVQEGTADEARANLQGRHLPYVRLILDEFSQMRRAAADARVNLRIGASKDFKWCALFNPDSLFDLAAQFSEPVDGWSSVDENTPRWRSHYGLVLHRNGFHSPAVTEPDGARKYPYLINRAQIDITIKECHGNTEAKEVYTMVKGFPPRNQSELTVLSEADLITFHMREPAIWHERGREIIRVAGLDPAFTSGGDNCVLQPAEIGLVREGALVCNFLDPIYIPISASSERPAAYQITDGVIQAAARLDIPLSHIGVDDSGTQSVADILTVETGQYPIRFDFGASASDQSLSSTNLKPAKQRFKNQVTELWALLAEYGRFGQIRGLPLKAAEQLCLRRFKLGAGPRILESKKDFKKRLPGQKSPDEADAATICIATARACAGFLAGHNDLQAVGGQPNPGERFFRARSRIPRSNYTQGIDMSRLSAYSSNR